MQENLVGFSSHTTVLMPNFNHARYLPESLDAIFSQSLAPQEVIIIDDASTDQSVELIKEYQKRYPQLLLIQNKVNQGPVKALNIGLKHAKSTFLAFCSADDQVLPGFFEECEKWLHHYPNAGICCSDPSFFIDKKPYHFQRRSICQETQPTLFSTDRIDRLFLYTSFWIPSHASLFRKAAVLHHNGFDERLHHLSDWYLNIKIAMTHDLIYVPHSFGAFRLSSHSYGARWNRAFRKKLALYSDFFVLLSQESDLFCKKFRRSGVLGLLSSDCLFYLSTHPSLWKYLSRAFFRKICNFYRKIKRSF